eukprot:764088-Hanusia_phi.AAC.1
MEDEKVEEVSCCDGVDDDEGGGGGGGDDDDDDDFDGEDDLGDGDGGGDGDDDGCRVLWGKVFYYNVLTGESRWHIPDAVDRTSLTTADALSEGQENRQEEDTVYHSLHVSELQVEEEKEMEGNADDNESLEARGAEKRGDLMEGIEEEDADLREKIGDEIHHQDEEEFGAAQRQMIDNVSTSHHVSSHLASSCLV